MLLTILAVLILTVAVTGGIARVQAQQTIFNVPTTDVLPSGKVYVELDITAKPNEPRFSSFVPRVVVGTGDNVEIGLNVTGNIQPGADSTTLVPAIKWKFYQNEDKGLAIVAGSNLFIPVRNRAYKAGTYAYVQFSKSFNTGTRLGFGSYIFTKNVVAPNANRAGGQFTFEQAVSKRFAVQADWLTGRHTSGYFTPGGYFKFTPKLTGYAAYSIGNADAKKGNHFFYLAMGYNIN
ncbi:MAG: hypothetical protein H7Y30_13380, partial [Pyrinomonadaceae bacterium]|nr:hypothetical protein [Pyrinomonadaceae bacterium]